CSTPSPYRLPLVDQPLQKKSGSSEISQLIEEVDPEIDASLSEERKEEPGFTIPMEMNERVEKWIEYFSKTDRERFQRFLNNGEVYRAAILDNLRREGVPTELYYLGLIESGYNLGA